MDSLAPLTALMGRPGDVVVVSVDGVPSLCSGPLSHVNYTTVDKLPEQINASSSGVILIPWGWDASARHLAAALESPVELPSEKTVAAVNGRRFLAEFDTMHGESEDRFFDGKFGQLCNSVREVQEGIANLTDQETGQWVVKPAWSAAGRHQLHGSSQVLNSHQLSWLRRQFARGSYVYLEPWLPVIRECGVQLNLSHHASGNPSVELLGATELITDRNGGYTGSLLAADHDSLWYPAVAHAFHVAHRAAERGYFGPLGIDCMQVMLPNSRQVLRLCHDINARLTMGRLALQLRSYLGSTNTGVWLNSPNSGLPRSGRPGEHPAAGIAGIVEVIRVSPEMIGHQPTAVNSWLYVTNSPEAANKLVHRTRQQSNGGGALMTTDHEIRTSPNAGITL